LSLIGIVYFSATDATKQLVTSCIQGILKVQSVDTKVHRIQGKDIHEGRFVNQKAIDELTKCSAIVFASPTYMGGPAAQFKAFADATSELWCDQLWSGKIAAGITCGSAPNGHQGCTIAYFQTLAAQHGMIWIGLDSAQGYTDHGVNRLGFQSGVVAHASDSHLDSTDLESAVYLGARIASVVRLWNEPRKNHEEGTR